MPLHCSLFGLLCCWISLGATALNAAEPIRPNVLFIIADDASRSFGESYATPWIKTPTIDGLARAGLVFDNLYTPTSKCAPSRASLMTGRYPWQLEEAANHQPYFPSKFMTFTEALAAANMHCGGAGKTWGPGEAKTVDGETRNFALRTFGPGQPNNPGAAFQTFLEKRPDDKPFFYWFGSQNPHRPYTEDAGIAAGKKTTDIAHVPSYLPDTDLVRRDLLDYATEVEAFDRQVQSLVEVLEKNSLAENTLVIVTSDHGMPFPRVKGHTYDEAHHIPMVVRWPRGIASPGRHVKELISFIDVAPTLLELFGVDAQAAGMSPITGKSFTDLLQNSSKQARPFAIVGRERNDVLCRPGTPAGLGYPARGMRVDNWFYVHNFENDRWPCGDPELGLKDTDDSPSKRLIQSLGENDIYWQHAFGKRPKDQLFDLSEDPDCVHNLASDPKYLTKVNELRTQLMAELKRQEDPRALGNGAIFDNYLSPRMMGRPAQKNKRDAK